MIKVAIFGSECTGKTTLAQHLAEQYNTFWVPEFSRAYAGQKPQLDISDVVPIMQGQLAAEHVAMDLAQRLSKKMVICDTIPLSSLVYSDYYNGAVPTEAEPLAICDYSLYLLLNIDVPWKSDGIRGDNINRAKMHTLFENALKQRKINYTLIHGSHDERLMQAMQAVKMVAM